MRKIESAIIFRKQILPYSETFIAAQGKFLQKYTPLFTGYKNDLSGRKLLQNNPCLVLEEYTRSIELAKLSARLGLVNRSWLNAIRQYSPSIIHAHFLKDGIEALMLKEKLSLPLITTLHGHDITKKERKSLLIKSRSHFFARVDKVIAVSDYIYQKSLNSGCPEDKLVKHSIGIDIQQFTQEKSESELPELLFVGRLTGKKGCIYLLQAMLILKTRYPDIKLTIVGDGPLKKGLVSYAKENSLNVDFVGKEPAERIRSRLARSWVFVAPSITAENGDAEGLGMVFLEAQALKTPVASFRSGGVVEAVKDGTTGLLAEEKDVASLADNIAYFIDSESTRIEYGANGRERVEQKFDIRKQCLLLEDIYDSVR
jgi:glycosyltransferase involved in cell wall biosynthesis